MGAKMAERLMRGGHQVVAYDRDPVKLVNGEEIFYISNPALGL